ncbi:hypothetical protein EYR41_012021 [Orbilia oligospora]|uniref:Uncharacterized protein n=1 Tax=Orbilia oligospora TaxID=2813651 RepID=A0A7C8PVB6_ORBOL|nr:hypothetical protein TWF751_010257 [Orbilia oligospora]TGJ62840.1 hypothetical protein EYR41_012021 [Orbilia oligospora]
MPQKLAPWPDDATPYSFLKLLGPRRCQSLIGPVSTLRIRIHLFLFYFFECVSFPWKFEPLLQGGERVSIEQNASADIMLNAWSHPALSWELTPRILWTGPPLCRGLHWMGGKKGIKNFPTDDNRPQSVENHSRGRFLGDTYSEILFFRREG